MDHLTVYESFDVESYIGKPIACDLRFTDQHDQTYSVTIYDNSTYCITHPAQRDYKRADASGMEANADEFNQIDPGFRTWLTTELKKHYTLP